MRKPLDLASVLLLVSTALYPLLSVAGVHFLGAGAVVVLTIVTLGARAAFRPARQMPAILALAPLAVAFALAGIASIDATLSVRLYPAFMNLAMLVTFAATLWRPPSMIERFARILEPDLPESGVRYTRNVTVVWIAFFAINGGIALWTALYASWRTWTIYNGMLAYLAMGVLFSAEYLVRRRVRARYAP